jgi:hypothetical protein
MKKRRFGVAPHSYSGLRSHVVIRARGRLVTLLVGIISEESSKRDHDPHPFFLTTPASNESTTPKLFFLSQPVRRGLE